MFDKRNYDNAFNVLDEKSGKKIVYIMADKSCIKYAHYLQTLISETGKLKCCIYRKDVYINNMDRASSENVIIFIGKNEVSREVIEAIKPKKKIEGKYGVYRESTGTRAILWTESVFWNRDEKKKFFEYYNECFNKFSTTVNSKDYGKMVMDAAVLIGFGAIGLGVKKYIYENIIAARKLRDYQYRASIMEFVNNDLDKFMEVR